MRELECGSERLHVRQVTYQPSIKGGQKMSLIQDKAPIFSLISVVGVAFISIYGGIRIESIKDDTASLDRQIQQQEVDLKRQIFEAELKASTNAILIEWLPGLVSESISERRSARAVLFALFPDEAPGYVSRALTAAEEGVLTEAEKEEVQKQIEEIIERTGPWIVVVTTHNDLDSARSKAKDLAGMEDIPTPISIYLRDNRYVVTVGELPSEAEANSALIVVREKVTLGAFTRDRSAWCPNPDNTPLDTTSGESGTATPDNIPLDTTSGESRTATPDNTPLATTSGESGIVTYKCVIPVP